jgi:hypothetical protein
MQSDVKLSSNVIMLNVLAPVLCAFMLSVTVESIMLFVSILSAVMLGVVMLNAEASNITEKFFKT